MFSIGNNILFFVPYLLDHRMNNLSAYAFYFMNWLHRSLYFFGLSLCPFFNLPPFFVYSDSIGLIKLPLKVPLNFMVLKIETYFLSVLEATAPGQGASWFGSWWGTVISQLCSSNQIKMVLSRLRKWLLFTKELETHFISRWCYLFFCVWS